jgi:hypothetical protein
MWRASTELHEFSVFRKSIGIVDNGHRLVSLVKRSTIGPKSC